MTARQRKLLADYAAIKQLSPNNMAINISSSDFPKYKDTLDYLEEYGYICKLNVDIGFNYVYMKTEAFDSFTEYLILQESEDSCDKQIEGNMDKEGEVKMKIISLIDMIPEIKRQLTPSFAGIKTIVRNNKFVDWKNNLIFQLKKLKQDDLILGIFKDFESINGFKDEYGLNELCSKLEILKENIEDYVPKDSVSDGLGLINNKKIFIVHGHDEVLKYKVSDWLRSVGLDPVILHLTANCGITSIIDKIKVNSDVKCAIVLMTADDVGKGKSDSELKPRARQNVVFEAGYFIGKLGEDRVILLCDEDIETPGDLAGCVYIAADKHDGWKEQVRREFSAMGIEYVG